MKKNEWWGKGKGPQKDLIVQKEKPIIYEKRRKQYLGKKSRGGGEKSPFGGLQPQK